MNQPVTWGPPRPERADAARNRQLLLATAREIIAEQGADKLTMDRLAERAGLGKGTVFRRFGTRAGIFHALLDDSERDFQEQVLSGRPPLGPGAEPLDRLIAYGRARIDFLIGHRQIARSALDGREQIPAGSQTPMSRAHIRFLLGDIRLGAADLDVLATQLTAALDGPLLLYLSSVVLTETGPEVSERLGRGWEDLVRRVTREQLPGGVPAPASAPWATAADVMRPPPACLLALAVFGRAWSGFRPVRKPHDPLSWKIFRTYGRKSSRIRDLDRTGPTENSGVRAWASLTLAWAMCPGPLSAVSVGGGR
jgi:AcrR family transcriptional regulator